MLALYIIIGGDNVCTGQMHMSIYTSLGVEVDAFTHVRLYIMPGQTHMFSAGVKCRHSINLLASRMYIWSRNICTISLDEAIFRFI